jgi:hypothetical protein
MNLHDVVEVRATVVVTLDLEDAPIEIKAGWRGTIVAQADTPTPGVEYAQYRERPILVDLDATNLEVVRAILP